ncbi:DUF2213 domain-containing protein [Aurantimonas sp. A2-1-M11]|uniref:DUF2213 domain-containing protein n=1 Tax=Aurantimonas sp. A2-1-M11 TaxID=3113712 RepID=UPI002F94900A
MLLLDAATVKGKGSRISAPGYLVATVRLARSGVYEYHTTKLAGRTSRSCGFIGHPPKCRHEAFRPLANAPVTIGRPVDAVSSSTWRRDAIGTVGEEIGRDGEFVTGTMRVQDAEAIRKIQAGTSEMSCGYQSLIEWTAGVTRRPIP